MTVRRNWGWLLMIFIVINAAAYLYIRYTKYLYESASELKLDIESNATALGIKGVVEDQNVNIVSGEIEIIQSRLFLNQVAKNPDFQVSFYSIGRVLNEELFNRAPARVTVLSHAHSFYDRLISFEEESPQQYILSVGNLSVTGTYGEPVQLRDLSLILERNENFVKGDEIGYSIILHSQEALLNYLSSNLTAEPLNFNANTLRLSFKDYNPYKAQAVLNKIDSLYLQYSHEQKNLATRQKINWLVNELSHIEQKMEDYEDYFENFTLQNKTNDLSEDLKETVRAINTLDTLRYNTTQRIIAVTQMIDALNKNQFDLNTATRSQLPADIISRLVELSKLQLSLEKLSLSYKETTFAYRQRQKDLDAQKSSLQETLVGLRDDLTRKLKDFDQRKARLQSEFALLPDKSTEHTKNQRFYKLYEELYLSLMQSKSEFEITQAGTTPDFKILSPASFPTEPISPKNLMIFGAGFVVSLTVMFFFVGILYLANNKITNTNELEHVTRAPMLGAIPLSNYYSEGLFVMEHPKSRVSEAIRSLRTNLDFFQYQGSKKVIAISSTVSGEGKSFVAVNLGAVIAMSRKRVILLDLDMRKAKANTPVPASDQSKGISTILIKRNSWQECVTHTPLEGFDLLPAGPHPPNPSELLLNGEFTTLINELKEHYDFIILDTPPVGLLTDGIMAMKRADISVYVFRANYSKKEFLSNLERLMSINKFDNITTVLNAVPVTGKTYGFSYYEEANKRRKKLTEFFKR